jgi:uncharacterized membrane protein
MFDGANSAARCAHPTLVVFPVIVLGTSVVFDAMYLHEANWLCAEGANVTLMTGLIAMAVALPFVVLDCWHLGARARVVTKLYGVATVLSIACFSVSWLLRGADSSSPTEAAMVFSFLGGANLLATAWLRDELLVAGGVHG